MAKRKFQWHPLFARLLRPHLEGYYELQTAVPVGDLPRQADIVLLRRTGTGALPFRGLSTVDLAVDEDSLPLHVLGIEPPEKQHQVGLFMVADQQRFHAYGNVFSGLHPTLGAGKSHGEKQTREI